MQHSYKITGMSCNGCRSHVEKALNEVKGVRNASVNLEKAEAEIEMETHIELETFQKSLKEAGGNYQIHFLGEEENFSEVSNFGKVKNPSAHRTPHPAHQIHYPLPASREGRSEKKTRKVHRFWKFKQRRSKRTPLLRRGWGRILLPHALRG